MRCPECNGEGWTTYLGGCWQQCRTCKGRRELDVSIEKVEDLSKDKVVVAESRPAVPPCGPGLHEAAYDRHGEMIVVTDPNRNGPLTINRDGMTYRIKPGTKVTIPQSPHGTQEMLQLLLDKVDQLEAEVAVLKAMGRAEHKIKQDDENVFSHSIVLKPDAEGALPISSGVYSPEQHRLIKFLVTATSDLDGSNMSRQGLVLRCEVGPMPFATQIPCDAFEGPMRPPHEVLFDYQQHPVFVVKNRDKLRPIRFDVTVWARRVQRIDRLTKGDVARLIGGSPHGR